MTRSPPQTARRSVLATVQSMPKNPSFFSLAQAHVDRSAPPTSDAITTLLPIVKEQSYGMEPQGQPGRMTREDSSQWMVFQSVSTGRFQKGVLLQATPSDTGAPGAEKQVMEPSSALMQRRRKTLSPYAPKAWSTKLDCFGLQDKYASLVQGLEDGLHLGVPKILHTYTPSNQHSINTLHDVYNSILENEFAAGQFISPFLHCQLEAKLGPFQASPLSLIPKVSKLGKYWAVHDFSYPHTPLAETTSINTHINSNNLPCTWGTFSTVALLIAQLPPGSQALVQDMAEAYRTIPVHPNQWPGMVIQLQVEDQFVVNVCNNFRLASVGGMYSLVTDTRVDIFQGNSIGPLAKWVNDHIFFRIPCNNLAGYNTQRTEWQEEIKAHRGCRKEGGRV